MDGDALARYDVFKEIPWLSVEWAGNTVYAYLLTIASFVVIWGLLHILRRYVMARLSRQDAASRTRILGFLRTLLGRLSPGVFPLLALYPAAKRLEMAGGVERGIRFLALFAVTTQVAVILGELAGYLIDRSRMAAGREDDPVIRNTNQNLTTLAKFAVWVGVLLFLLDNLGFNVSTFIAGLGIGGVAIALATQAILGDTFSSFAIALDKPFEVGDFIIVDDMMGNVEHIGLKTTRIRSLSGEQLIFANSDLTKSRVKNFKKMYERRVVFKIGVTYETPRDKLGRIVEILQQAITSKSDTRIDRVHFSSFGDSSLIFEAVYMVLKPEYNTYMDIQQAINFEIVEAFEREGISMAYPTQTVFLSRPKT